MAEKKPKKVAKPLETIIEELKAAFAARSIIVDLSDGPCQLCAITEARSKAASESAGRPVPVCSRCGADDFTQGVHSDGTKHMGSAGFRSVKPSHYHLWIGESAAAGKEAQWDELCINCYREDYMRAYPKAKKPPV